MKVVIYARVSTDDKDQNPDRQLIRCRRYCEDHGHTIVKELVDYHTGDSSLSERPSGSQINNYSDHGLVFFSMDRLTREHPTKVMLLLNNLEDRGIKVMSATEPAFNLESDFSEVILYIMSWFNNWYLKELKKNVKSGLDRARARGKVLGRPKAKFNEYRAYELLINQNKPLREVAKELNSSPATLMRFKKVALENPLLFIKEPRVSQSPVIETNLEEVID